MEHYGYISRMGKSQFWSPTLWLAQTAIHAQQTFMEKTNTDVFLGSGGSAHVNL